MGSGSNPSIKTDIFADEQAPDVSSPEVTKQNSSQTDEHAGASSQSYALPQNLPSALRYLDDDQLDRLRAAVFAEQQRRGKPLPVTNATPGKRRVNAAPSTLTLGKLNAIHAAFKAGVTPSRIAREFGVSQADVRRALASDPSK